MNKKEITEALGKKGYDQVKLADRLGKSQSAISQILGRKSTSVDIMQEISNIIGVPFYKVWDISKNDITPNRRKL